jgi:hypothetical protein
MRFLSSSEYYIRVNKSEVAPHKNLFKLPKAFETYYSLFGNLKVEHSCFE